MKSCPHGFWVCGRPTGERVPVDWSDAFARYACCGAGIDPADEAYLSAFTFADDFLAHTGRHGSPKGFDGVCHGGWVWVDIDRPSALDAALADTRRLVCCLLDRFTELDDEDLLTFFSGGKGFHVGVPTAATRAAPSPSFNRAAMAFAGRVAGDAGVPIDGTVYDKPRLFRAPNSRHPKTGLHKRRLTHRELMGLSAGRVRELAADPDPFDVPAATATSDAAAALWAEAEAAITAQREGVISRRGGPAGRLQRATLDLIHGLDLPGQGEREVRVFRAAANLTEAGCPHELVATLLEGPGRDCGLSPAELRHAVTTGVAHVARRGNR